MLSKMRSKIMCFLEHRFGKVLGRVLGGFWEAKNLDFRTFGEVFGKVREERREREKKKEKREGREGGHTQL